MKIPARKLHLYFLSAKFSCFFLYWHLGGLPRWHFATTSDTRRLSAHRFRSRPGCERWLTVPPPAKLWCGLLVRIKSVGQVSVLIRAALLGDGDWQYHVLKRENNFPCLLRLNVIGCFRSQGYKMGGRPSCAPQCHFQRGLNSVRHRHTFDLRNVHVYMSLAKQAPQFIKLVMKEMYTLCLKDIWKIIFFPFFLFLKA